MEKGAPLLDGSPREVFAHDKQLEKIGLAVPQVTYLMHDLAAKGYPVDPDVTTVEEAKQEILRVFGNR
jgi:energy-coupling factor transport system ATP-binding protein